MVQMTGIARIVLGLAFLLGAVVLFAGLLPLGGTVSLALGVLDLVIGLALVGSGLGFGRREGAVGAR